MRGDRSFKKRLDRRTEEALARLDRAREETSGRSGDGPREGEVFAFAATAALEPPVLWAVIRRDSGGDRLYGVVAADLDPLAGSADVPVPPRSACGALTLRCGHLLSLAAGDFREARFVGRLEDEVLSRAQDKRAAIEAGVPPGSALEQEIDDAWELRYSTRERLQEARSRLADSLEMPVPSEKGAIDAQAEPAESPREAQTGKVVAFPSRSPGAFSDPLMIAASVLLVLALGLGGGLVWQHRESQRLVASHQALEENVQAREDRYRREVAELERERQQAEEGYRRQLAELRLLLEGAVPSAPHVNLPVVFLNPLETLRSEGESLLIPAEAQRVALVLHLTGSQPFPRYRLEIVGRGTGKKVWSIDGLTENTASELSFDLPRSYLSSGDYRLDLYGLSGGEPQLVDRYGLSIRTDLEP